MPKNGDAGSGMSCVAMVCPCSVGSREWEYPEGSVRLHPLGVKVPEKPRWSIWRAESMFIGPARVVAGRTMAVPEE